MRRADLRRIVAEVLEIDPEKLSPDAELGQFETFDSVSVLTLMVELDEKAGVKIGPAEAAKLHTYGEIEELARRQGIELSE